MNIQNFWKNQSFRKNRGNDSLEIDQDLDLIEASFNTLEKGTQYRDEMTEIYATLDKMVVCYKTAKIRASLLGGNDVNKDLIKVRNQIQIQKVIVKTLFQLAKQGCATVEEIRTIGTEGVRCAGRVEKEVSKIIKVLPIVHSKNEIKV